MIPYPGPRGEISWFRKKDPGLSDYIGVKIHKKPGISEIIIDTIK